MQREYWKYRKTTEEEKTKYWKAKEKKLEELTAQRKAIEEQLKKLTEQKKELSKQIHSLQVELNNHKKYAPKGIKTDTEVYKMFGKSLNELTKEEYRIYYNARQRINRRKRKRSKGEKQNEMV